MVARLDGNAMEGTSVFQNAEHRMEVTESGRAIGLVNEPQSLKACLPIVDSELVATDVPSSTVRSELQRLKASFPMPVTESGMAMDSSELQP